MAALGGRKAALADHKADHCAKEGQRAHPDQNHPKSCCPGLFLDADGRCVAGCPNAFLTGGPGMQVVFVDDDLEVLVNGATVLVDDDELASFHPPIPLGAVANGDTVRVVASNSTTPLWCFNGEEILGPLYLFCPTTGETQTLDADGVPLQPAGGCGHVFYDEGFTVAL